MRTSLIAGNWKMFKTPNETEQFFKEFIPEVADVKNIEILLCVPSIDLGTALKETKGSVVQIGAQNAHWEKEGAYTGEISMKMLKDIDCPWVLIGHSERREYFGETNDATQFKIKEALAQNIKPILCVGETLAEREAGETESKVATQVTEGMGNLSEEQAGQVVIAYEPIWAIGTGKTATSEDAQKVCRVIREVVREQFGKVADVVRILYGGSVKPDNAKELLAQPDIDGALVGGASLKPSDFSQIVKS